MGSVQSNINCPDCGSDRAIEDYHYKSGEVYITCQKCGYYYHNVIKRDDAGKPIIVNGEYQWEEKKQHGAGIYEIHRKGGIGYGVGTLEVDEKKRKKQIQDLKEYEKKEEDITIKIKEYKR